MKIVVPDSNDTAHDSAIFLREDSLRSENHEGKLYEMHRDSYGFDGFIIRR